MLPISFTIKFQRGYPRRHQVPSVFEFFFFYFLKLSRSRGGDERTVGFAAEDTFQGCFLARALKDPPKLVCNLLRGYQTYLMSR